MAKVVFGSDEVFMRRALALAEKGRGKVSPNPLVGAVLVYKGAIIAEGYHRGFGLPHAEAELMKQFAVLRRQKKWTGAAARKVLREATLYVTLEPCVHFEGKKTPGCAPLLAEAGVQNVVIASIDVCAPVRGKGASLLRSAGVKVKTGVLKQEEERMNEVYRKNMLAGLPFVTVKLGMTLDGRIAAKGGDSRWITSEVSRRKVHQMRAEVGAILTSSATVMADGPRLDVRMGVRVKGAGPLRIVLDRQLRTSVKAKLYRDGNVLVVTEVKNGAKAEAFERAGVTLVWMKSMANMKRVMRALFALGVRDILVEAGGTFVAELLKAGMVDKAVFFVAPGVLGGDGVPAIGDLGITQVARMLRLKEVKWEALSGGDLCLTGRFQ